MQSLTTLVYRSTQTAPLTPTALNLLVQRARIFNQRVDVTGALLYDGFRFIQCLEGPQAAVDSIYATICRDTRHTDVTTLLRNPLSERAFEKWQMGFVPVFADDRADMLKKLGLTEAPSPESPARRLLFDFFPAA